KVEIFFFDINDKEGQAYQRDSLMNVKIKAQFRKHPSWRMITLSGNYHNRISGEQTAAAFLLRDKNLKICTLNMEYSEGAALADFGKGLEVKQLGSYPSVYNSTLPWDRFILLVQEKSGYQYKGFYYTKEITAATLTHRE